MVVFTEKEIADAQAALDLYPDACPYWDARQGQETLYIADKAKLTATTTNRERVARYAEFKRECEAA